MVKLLKVTSTGSLLQVSPSFPVSTFQIQRIDDDIRQRGDREQGRQWRVLLVRKWDFPSSTTL